MAFPPNLRRYLPFVLVAFFLLILLPAIFKKSTPSTTASPATQSAETVAAIDLVDRSELSYQAAHGHYTAHVADLLVGSRVLARDLTNGFAVQLDVSSDGQSYFALVESPVLSILRARHDRKLAEQSCVVVKSGTGVSCPASASTSG